MARQATLARFEVSGEILSEDTIALLAATDCKLPGAEIDAGDFAAAWDLLSEQWQNLRQEIAGLDTERLRRRWVIPLLELLGHQPQYLRSHPAYAQNRTIPLTHRSGNLPLWLLDYGASPDSKEVTGRRRISPHELFQEYLDLSDDDWGVICNGRTIRLLHDYHKTLTRNYVEADLESIFDALDVDAFRAVWRIFRASSFQPGAKGVLPIEKLRDQSRQEGAEIGKELRKQVLDAIKTLGNGFLAADRSGEFQQALQENPTAANDFYQALLRIVYRLLFLLYIENKPGWTPATNPVWASSYSISRLREQAEELTSTRADAEDHWEGLKIVFGMIRNGCDAFNIRPYGGELFDDERLWRIHDAALRNSDLLQAIRLLTVFERKGQIYRVNFRTLRIDALGSVYEGLLDVAPVLTPHGTFDFGEGTERKLTGSYYTPPELVAELIKSALVPVIEDRLQGKESQADQEKALLSIKVVDPACGSGAFLIQALDKLSERLCDIRKEGEEPSELDIREARRDVVTHCIHGVDLNPMAVELCKFTLWLHCAHPQLPLSFLDHNLRCGNSLVGGFPKTYGREVRIRDLPPDIPDEAFDPVTGDAKEAAKKIKARNRAERTGKAATGQGTMQPHGGELHALKPPTTKEWDAYTEAMHALTDWPESDLASVERKHQRFEELRSTSAYRHRKDALDLWTAAYFWPMKDANDWNPTTGAYRAFATHGSAPKTAIEQARLLAGEARFFHWGLEFPQIFSRNGGFDCILGNPPWERIKIQEEEFFASRAPHITSAPNKAARQRLIDALDTLNPDLARRFQTAKHIAEAESKFLRRSDRFPRTAVGDVNTYALFAEAFYLLQGPGARAGIVCPIGIATDESTKRLFGELCERRSLVSLLGFENEDKIIFPEVHNEFKFCALTISSKEVAIGDYVFFCRNLDQSRDSRRHVLLSSDDFSLLNPNTRTCPIFRSSSDAALTKAIYSRVPVLRSQAGDDSRWHLRFQRMFDMANDSSLFQEAATHTHLPLYEAKMIGQYDHRFASYIGEGDTDGRESRKFIGWYSARYGDPRDTVVPRYWVDRRDVWCRVSQAPPELVAAYADGDALRLKKIIGKLVLAYHRDSGAGFSTHWQTDPSYAEALGPDWVTWSSDTVDHTGSFDLLTDAEIEHVRLHADDLPRVAEAIIAARCPRWLLAFRDVTNATNERTAILSVIPLAGAGHTAPVVYADEYGPELKACLLANLNSMVFDYCARQKVGGMHLSYGYLNQLPVLSPSEYTEAHLQFIVPRVLKLVYTAYDVRPFAEDLGAGDGPTCWNADERARVRAELDAYFARLYGLSRKQLRFVLDPFGLSDSELEDLLNPGEDPTCSGPHALPESPTQDFPSETFSVLRNNEMARYGEYRTRRLVLEAWARLEAELGPAPSRPPLARPQPVVREMTGAQTGRETPIDADKNALKSSRNYQPSLVLE